MRHLGYNLQKYCKEELKAELPFKFARLWRSWSQVVGEEAASLARPLGRRKRTLILGVEDGAAMQEATFYAPAILDDVNGFLGEVFFDKVQCQLLRDRTPLDEQGRKATFKRLPPRPAHLGNALQHMDPDSPVARSYQAYIAAFDKE